MTLRTAHGRAAKFGALFVVEGAPADELPEGVAAPARPDAIRDGAWRFSPGPGKSALAREGAKAAHESRQLAALLGFYEPEEGHPFARYTRLAREHRQAQGEALAASVGGGQLFPGVTSILASASLALAASRYRVARASGLTALPEPGQRSRDALSCEHGYPEREENSSQAEGDLEHYTQGVFVRPRVVLPRGERRRGQGRTRKQHQRALRQWRRPRTHAGSVAGAEPVRTCPPAERAA